jgi:hypothetical protein
MRDELLNETQFMALAHARVEIAAWVENYDPWLRNFGSVCRETLRADA